MSDNQTGEAALAALLEEALEKYLGQSGGGMVTSFAFIADIIDADGEERWLWATLPGQKTITTAGLVEWLHQVITYESQRHLAEEWGGGHQ